MPSTCTVHEPQEESSQPRLDPVSCKSRRKASSRSVLDSSASFVRAAVDAEFDEFFFH